jgi:hypothetical protein
MRPILSRICALWKTNLNIVYNFPLDSPSIGMLYLRRNPKQRGEVHNTIVCLKGLAPLSQWVLTDRYGVGAGVRVPIPTFFNTKAH